VRHFSSGLFKGRLQALPVNNRLNWKAWQGCSCLCKNLLLIGVKCFITLALVITSLGKIKEEMILFVWYCHCHRKTGPEIPFLLLQTFFKHTIASKFPDAREKFGSFPLVGF